MKLALAWGVISFAVVLGLGAAALTIGWPGVVALIGFALFVAAVFWSVSIIEDHYS